MTTEPCIRHLACPAAQAGSTGLGVFPKSRTGDKCVFHVGQPADPRFHRLRLGPMFGTDSIGSRSSSKLAMTSSPCAAHVVNIGHHLQIGSIDHRNDLCGMRGRDKVVSWMANVVQRLDQNRYTMSIGAIAGKLQIVSKGLFRKLTSVCISGHNMQISGSERGTIRNCLLNCVSCFGPHLRWSRQSKVPLDRSPGAVFIPVIGTSECRSGSKSVNKRIQRANDTRRCRSGGAPQRLSVQQRATLDTRKEPDVGCETHGF